MLVVDYRVRPIALSGAFALLVSLVASSAIAEDSTLQLGGVPTPVYKLLPAKVTDNLLLAPPAKLADSRSSAAKQSTAPLPITMPDPDCGDPSVEADPDCGDPDCGDQALGWRRPEKDDIADAFGLMIAPPSAQESGAQESVSEQEPRALELMGPELAPLTPTNEAEQKSKTIEQAKPEAPAPQTSAPVTPAPLTPPPAQEKSQTAPTQSAPDAKPQAAPKTEATPPAVATPPVKPLPPLSRNMQYLRNRLRGVLKYYYNKPLNTDENDPWEAMHGMLSYELHSQLRAGGRQSEPVTAIGHLCFNRPCKGMILMRLDDQGDIAPRIGVGLQGHEGQFLAMLAQCNVTPEYPIRVEGKEFTIQDLIRSEQKSCRSKTELTFKLIGLRHYLPSDATWVAEDGQRWDIPRLIREERFQPIRGAACGGTHRLSGLSLAYQKCIARGEPITGEYAEARKFVTQYQNYCFSLQNDDGSLSTEWFRGPGDEDDIERRLRTTGHQVEWLAYSMPDEKLQYYRMVRAVNYLVNLLSSNPQQDWHNGSRAHALHALVVYDKRLFVPYDNQPQVAAAAPETKPRPTTVRPQMQPRRTSASGRRYPNTTQRRPTSRAR